MSDRTPRHLFSENVHAVHRALTVEVTLHRADARQLADVLLAALVAGIVPADFRQTVTDFIESV